MAEFLQHGPCPACGSSDANAHYGDGSTHCFTCKKYTRGDGTIEEVDTTPVGDWTPVQGEYADIPSRGLKRATCEMWGYQTGTHHGRPCHIANIKDASGRIVCQKLRLPGKQFPTLGDRKQKPLYGQWLWKNGGKHIVITEGELDALSVSQAMDLKWPVVSLPDGADSAEKAITRAYDFLDGYERIVLMFDQDEPGRRAAEVVAQLLPPGKVAVALLPHKDANEVLLKDGPGAIIKAFWNAPTWKPDGIVEGSEFTLEKVRQAAVTGFAFPYPKLQSKVLGMRKGELTLWTAGSGIGKSTMVREMGHYLHEVHGCYIGNVFLEENNVKTAQAYVAIDNNVPLGRLRFDPALLTEEQWRVSLDRVVHKGMWFYNHFGSLESKNLIGKLRYLATVKKVDFILLDHISIVTSGMESSSEGERKDIDILMTRLRQLVEETGVGVNAIVHLKRVIGKNFNEGDQVSLSDLRGSGSLEQLPDNVVAIERDQQGKEGKEPSTKMTLRVLKCRETGETGRADILNYNRQTGRIELAGDVSF